MPEFCHLCLNPSHFSSGLSNVLLFNQTQTDTSWHSCLLQVIPKPLLIELKIAHNNLWHFSTSLAVTNLCSCNQHLNLCMMYLFFSKFLFMLLLVFLYRWCGPCKQLAPKLDSLIEMKDGAIELAKVDVDENAELAMQYGVCIIYT